MTSTPDRSTPELPDYRQLPLAEHGVHSGWGVFGPEDGVGLLNLLSPETVVRAAHAVRSGRVYPLDLPSDYFSHPFFQRGVPELRAFESRPRKILDDVRNNVWSQSTSQWDSLAHVAWAEDAFYNGATTEEVLHGHRNTVDQIARRGVAGRGVLLDVAESVAERGGPGASTPIRVEDLEAARERAGLEYQVGDILLVRSGFTRWYAEQDDVTHERLSHRDLLTATGLDHSEEMVEYLWDSHIAAIAGDMAATEVWPPDERPEAEPFGYLHQVLIGQLGLPLGELWFLDDLAEASRADGRYYCLVVAAPQNVPGAVGSPANAVAIR